MRNNLPTNPQSGGRLIRHSPDPLDISAGNNFAQAQGTEYTGIAEYFAMARRRWWVILAIVLLSTGYTFNSVRTEKPRFKSRATVRLVDQSRAIAGNMGDQSAARADMPFSAGADPIESQLQVLQSEAVVSAAVDLKGLRLVPDAGSRFVPAITNASVSDSASASTVTVDFAPTSFTVRSGSHEASAAYGSQAEVDGVRLLVSKRPQVQSAAFRVISKAEAVESILERFQASGRPRTDIIDLSYTDFEPFQATRVANAMAEAYQLYNASSARQFSQRRRTFLEAQLRQADSSVDAANLAYAAFHENVETRTATSTAANTNAAKASADRANLESQKRALEALLGRARQPGQTAASNVRAIVASPTASANALVQQLVGQLGVLEATHDNLVNTGAAATNPDLVTVNSQIAATNSRLIDAVDGQLQSINTTLGAMKSSPGDNTFVPVATGGGDARDGALLQQVQAAQKVATDIREDLQKAKVSEAVEAGQVEIVQLDNNPGYQVSTGSTRRILLGLIVGLMFGFGAAVLVDGLDKSIRKRGDIEPLLGIPGLVVVPKLERAGSGSSRMLPASAGRLVARGDRDEATQGDTDLVTVSNPRSPAAEAFRTLRTNLMFSQAVSEMRTLVVTSASPSEGKTVTASNLAVSFAQQGLRVLLIDCDLRKGRLHRVFNVAREPGMSDFILGFSSEEQVTRPTGVNGLYIMPTGKLPPNPSELLGGEAAKKKLKELTEGYDLLIIDTPPLLAASDAAILSTLSDGVIMVLRAGATETAAAQQAVQQLQVLNARVVGAVLNDPDAQVSKYGAYYEYDYSSSGSG